MSAARHAIVGALLATTLATSRLHAATFELEPNVDGRASFGAAVAQDARWIFVGDAPPRDPGKLWIWEKGAAAPAFRQMIDGATAFGCGIAVSVNEIAVAECLGPAVRIYALEGAKWVEKAKLSEVPEGSSDPSTMGIAYDGPDKLIIGRLKFPKVSLYTRTSGTWTRTGEISAAYTMVSDFGAVVRRFGDQLAIAGREYMDSGSVGRVQLYKRNATGWVADGPPFPNASGTDGTTIEKVGTQWLIGDPFATVNARFSAGATYVFSLAGATWKLDQTLISPDPQPNGFFGRVVAAGNLVVANDPGLREIRNLVRGTTWTQVAPRKITTKNASSVQGSMSLVGATLVVGAPAQTGKGSALVMDLTCATDADCGAGTFCDPNGLCGAQGAPGSTCSRDTMCASGYCTDGVCCASRCQGVCEACDVSGSVGTCIAVTGAPHQTLTKRPACPSDAADACSQRSCDGTTRTSCAKLATSDVVCRAASCIGATQTSLARCDGTGKCPTTQSSSCGGFVCASNVACKAACANRFDCEDGHACVDGLCVKRAGTCGPDGASVVAADGTTSSCNGFVCVDGACLTKCTQSIECGAGRVCDVASATCVESTSAAEDDGGCASRRSARSTSSFGLGLLVLGLAARRLRKAVGR